MTFDYSGHMIPTEIFCLIIIKIDIKTDTGWVWIMN